MPGRLYIGLELNEREVRLCVYNKIKKDADTIMTKTGGKYEENPAHMVYAEDIKQWKFGIEADYLASHKGYTVFDNILEHCLSGRDFEAEGKTYPCETVVAEMICQIVACAGVKEPITEIGGLVLTVPRITKAFASTLERAFSDIGFENGQAYFQCFDESFYTYTYWQKPDVFSRDVGMFYFKENDEVEFSRLHLDPGTRPAVVTVGDNAYEVLSADPQLRDKNFEAFILNNTAGWEFSSFFLVGSGFDRQWANKSLALLSKAQRKVFYGNNLFAKGACFSAYEKKHPSRLRNLLFLGKDLVTKNIGLDMYVDGLDIYHPLVTAGVNWFDAENSCDLILNGQDKIVFKTSRLKDGKRAQCTMLLEGLPKRPPKTTRLRVGVRFENVEKCVITVKDLGFGEIYPSSGKIWTDVI